MRTFKTNRLASSMCLWSFHAQEAVVLCTAFIIRTAVLALRYMHNVIYITTYADWTNICSFLTGLRRMVDARQSLSLCELALLFTCVTSPQQVTVNWLPSCTFHLWIYEYVYASGLSIDINHKSQTTHHETGWLQSYWKVATKVRVTRCSLSLWGCWKVFLSKTFGCRHAFVAQLWWFWFHYF